MEILEGTGIANGIAIGHALVLFDEDAVIYRETIEPEEMDGEIEGFHRAIKEAKKQIGDIKDQVQGRIGEEHAFIFDAHVMFLDDKALLDQTIALIRDDLRSAEWAFNQTLLVLLKNFEGIGDPYFEERAKDLEDVGKRVLHILLGAQKDGLKKLANDIIVIGTEFGPSNITTFDNPKILGFATDFGGPTTHTAIIAKALGLPAVLGLHHASRVIRSGDHIILDSFKGRIFIDPDEKTLKKYQRLSRQYKKDEKIYIDEVIKPTISKDDLHVELLANIEIPSEVDTALKHGARGIGLYRTEFLFLEHSPNFPSEEDHYRTYCRLSMESGRQPVTIRTLDLGGEKFFHRTFVKEKEVNPVLGLRGVRLCLRRKDIFKVQLRGLLRAAADHENISIMFPLITSVTEYLEVKAFLKAVRDELKSEGLKIPKNIPVGIMIEVPSAAMVADFLAQECDFISIGTNDLIQYFLAIDRANDDVNYLYDPFHPGFLRLLKFVIDSANDAGITVTCCGEIASSPIYATLLVHMGLRTLSMNPTSIPNIHHLIRAMDFGRFAELIGDPIRNATASQYRRHFKSVLAEVLPRKDYKKIVASTRKKKRAT